MLRILLLYLLLFPIILFGQTYITSTEVGGQTWKKENSPYYIETNLTVSNGTKLTIQPNVQIIFKDNYSINIQGCINALGTFNEKISFTTENSEEKWNGIKFNNTLATNITSIFEYCIFNNSKSQSGGAIYTNNFSNLIIKNCIFYDNIASSYGGAISLNSSNAKIISNLFYNNYGHSVGGAIHSNTSSPTIINNTFYKNKCSQIYGTEIFIRKNYAKITLSNNIFWNNEDKPLIYFYYANTVDLFNNILKGGIAKIGHRSILKGTYKNNYDLLPEFKNSENHDFSLTKHSPCINAGSPQTDLPTTDLAGNDRIYEDQENLPDIGVYEFQGKSALIINNNITTNTTLCTDYKYKIFNDIIIPEGVTLTICPGTIIEFMGEYKLKIEGRLIAKGEENSRISFIKNEYSENWKGIEFVNNTSVDSSYLTYCNISNAKSMETEDNALGGGLLIKNTDKISVTDCLFENNQAIKGGALYIENSSPKIYNNVFKNNIANEDGGAVYFQNSNFDFANNFITNNSAISGGGIYANSLNSNFYGNQITNNTASNNGGAIYLSNSNSIILNNTIANNLAQNGGGLYLNNNSSPEIKNSIIWENQATQGNQIFIETTDCEPKISYSNIDGSKEGFEGTGAGSSYTFDYINQKNINLEPNFISSSTGTGKNYDGFSANWTLANNSPCINSGDQNTTLPYFFEKDIKKLSRKIIQINNCDVIDMGANEFPTTQSNERYSDITSSLTWGENNNEIKILCDITIKENATLTIKEGTKIIFPHNHKLNVKGNIIAEGSLGNEIIFTGDTVFGWGGITYENLSQNADSSKFNYCKFELGKAKGSYPYFNGGIFFIDHFSKLKISNSNFINNKSDYDGGGIFCSYSNPIIENSIFENNYCGNYGGAIHCFYSSPKIKNNTFLNNEANRSGGAIFAYFANNIKIINNKVSYNSAKYGQGGAIYFYNSASPEVTGNLIHNNFGKLTGGAIHIGNSDPLILNNTIVENKTNRFGGALYFEGNSLSEVTNNIVWNNYASNGLEVYLNSSSSKPIFKNNNIKDGKAKFSGSGATTFDLTGEDYSNNNNIKINPIFIDEKKSNYKTQSTSPCINSGINISEKLPNTDLWKLQRIFNNYKVDIGAYEFPNNPPLNINLSNNNIPENSTINSEIGILTTEEFDGNNVTYSFTTGDGINDIDNNKVKIEDDKLLLNSQLNFEEKNELKIHIKVIDDGFGNCFTEKAFILQVNNINEVPSAINLSQDSIQENQTIGTLVGELSTIDPELENTHIFELCDGDGCTDNDSFEIVNNQLKSKTLFDFETQKEFSIRIKTTENNTSDSFSFEKIFKIKVFNQNEAITNLTISNSEINENIKLNSFIATIVNNDPDKNDEFSYWIGDTPDTEYFKIINDTLKTNKEIDFEFKNSYNIIIKASDIKGLGYQQNFTLTVNDQPEAPKEIYLSNFSINENEPINTQIGIISSLEQDVDDVNTYTLTDDIGDNKFFTIENNTLKTLNSFNFEAKDLYTINILATDKIGLKIQKEFTISVIDINETPTNIELSSLHVMENSPIGTQVATLSTIDQDVDNFTYALTGLSEDNSKFYIDNDTLKVNSLFSFEDKQELNITLTTNDKENKTYTKNFTITVHDKNELPDDILLSNSQIEENSTIGTTIGSFSTIDEDNGEDFKYSIIGENEDANYFSIDDNILKTNSEMNFEERNSFSVRIKTLDKDNLSIDKLFTISLKDVNDAPTDILLSPDTIEENKEINSIIGNLKANDEDNTDTYTYSFIDAQGYDNNLFIIDGDKLKSNTSFNFENRNSYTIFIRATENTTDLLHYDKAIKINIKDINEAPTGIELSNNSIDENSEIATLIGRFSTTDPDNNEKPKYTFISGTNDNHFFTIKNDSLLVNSAFNFETKSSFTIEIKSTDKEGLETTEAFTININDLPETPTNILLSSNEIEENNLEGATIGEIQAIDEDESSEFSFTLLQEFDYEFFNLSNEMLLASKVFNFESKNSYRIKLKVTDNTGLTFEKEFNIIIKNKGEVPSSLTLSNNRIMETVPISTEVGILSAEDEDFDDIITYNLVAGNGATDNNSFTISENKLLTNSEFSFELQQTLNIRILAQDKFGLEIEKTFQIQLENENTTPPQIDEDEIFVSELQQKNTSFHTLAFSDADNFNFFEFYIEGGTGADLFTIDKDKGEFQLIGDIDYEAQTNYTLDIRVFDGKYETRKTLNVNIIDENEFSPIIENEEITIAENYTVGNSVLNFTVNDQDPTASFNFEILSGNIQNIWSVNNETKELFTNSNLDYETIKNYTLSVKVSDGNFTDTAEVKIYLTDINEFAPNLENNTVEISENSLFGDTIYIVKATDEDITAKLFYKIASGNEEGKFEMEDSTGIVKLIAFLDYETTTNYQLNINVSDGLHTNSGILNINILDGNDNAPVVTNANIDILENIEIGTIIHTTEVIDDNPTDLTFSLNETTSENYFEVNNSGEISLIKPLDYEILNKHKIFVTVHDGIYSGNGIITLNVQNENETPSDIIISNQNIQENQAAYSDIATLTTLDSDNGDLHTYSLVLGEGDNDNSKFIIVGSKLKTTQTLDFEIQNTCSIRLRTTDLTGLYFEKIIQFTIEDTNDIPNEIELSNKTIDELLPIGSLIGELSAIDQDENDSHTFELISTGNSSLFQIIDNQLKTKEILDYETQNPCIIQIKTNDQQGDNFTQEFIIEINDKNDNPIVEIPLQDYTTSGGNNFKYTIPPNSFIDPDFGDKLDFILNVKNKSIPNWISFNSDNLTITGNPPESLIGEFIFSLKATDNHGAYISDDFNINIQSASLIDEENNKISISPNPTIDKIHISFSKNYLNSELILLTNTGQKIIQQKIEKKDIYIDLSNKSAGVYLLKIIGKDFIKIEKIIKQ